MKFGLLTVSYSGLFYDGPALSLVEQIRKARQLGFDGLSIETKRPVASPLDLTQEDRRAVRAAADAEGIELCALESMSNFASPLMEERENNLAMMRLVLDLAIDLGVPLVKVFAAWPGLINDEEATATYTPYEMGNYYARLYPADLRRWHRALDGLRETATAAAARGITLALQNHAPVLRPGYEDALAMLRELDRPNVGLCLDAPLFKERQSDDYMREAVHACRGHVRLTHYGAWNFVEQATGEVVQGPCPRSAERSTTGATSPSCSRPATTAISSPVLSALHRGPPRRRHRRCRSGDGDGPPLHEEPGDDAADGLSPVGQIERARLVGRTRLECPRTRS